MFFVWIFLLSLYGLRTEAYQTLNHCEEATTNGIYTIATVDVYCENDWLVIQRRTSGTLSFDRNWNDYKKGFGSLSGEHWLGLDNINRLTQSNDYQLRIDMTDQTGKASNAKYSLFKVGGVATRYKLGLGSFSGTAGDSLTPQSSIPGLNWDYTKLNLKGSKFSTKDSDNDGSSSINCATKWNGGGWWFNDCFAANLNGDYNTIGFSWVSRGQYNNLATSTMAIRNDVDGGWTSWGSWGSCSLSCQGGYTVKKRTCTNPKPRGDGKNCPGYNLVSDACNIGVLC